MKVKIICVGEELLSGDIVNTNSQYISQKLMDIGIKPLNHTTVGDCMDDIVSVTKQGFKNFDVLIFTGGLGPTTDDLTKEAVCKALNLELEKRDEIVLKMEKRFEKIGIKMSANNLKQAYMPKGCKEIPNKNGTAPGILINYKNKIVALLPGPPREMNPMLENYLIPELRDKSNFIIKSQTLKTMGIGESTLESKIRHIILKYKELIIATYAKEGQVDIKITCICQNDKQGEILIHNAVKEIKNIAGKYIYSYNGESLEEVVYRLLLERQLKVGFCESCTGGLISSRLIKIPGVSSVFDRGYITYSNKSKIEELNVSQNTLKKFGAVSKETALEMVKGLIEESNVDIGISVTGIAGPDGGTDEKPVGLVYIGLAAKEFKNVFKYVFSGSREVIQNRAANMAFMNLIKYLD